MAQYEPLDNVVIVEYDPHWPEAYREEAERIAEVLEHDFVDIQHVGSSAVPGLAAKPVIDVMVAVEHFKSIEEYSRRLAPLGYQHMTHPAEAVRIFFRKGLPRTHHLHIVEYGTREYRRHLLFRDYLRRHPEAAQAYEQLKRELADRFATDRPTYTESKTDFIRSVVALALAENGE